MTREESNLDKFKASLKTENTQLVMTSNIEVSSDIFIPAHKEIVTGRFKFIYKGGKIDFYGSLNSGRKQVFVDFPAGKIKGTMGGPVYPEWWGLIPNKHDIAINCAIQTCVYSGWGNTVSLAAGQYIISDSIDLRASLSQLEGQGSGATSILTSADFNPKFEDSNFWSNGVNVPESHAALIWIGSRFQGAGQSFRTNIRGVTVSGWHAVRKWRDKRISIISSTGWVEENHIIEDVCLSSFSGFGIGFHHPESISTTNGLALRNFWITQAVKRDAVPIYIAPHAVVCSIRSGTIDCRVMKESAENPDFPEEWPQFGIYAGGQQTIVEGVHLEGMGIGVYIVATPVTSSLKVSEITTIWLMDHNMKYFDDPTRVPGPAPEPNLEAKRDPKNHYFKYGSAVVLGKALGNADIEYNYNSTVILEGIHSLQNCKYLVRDWVYGINCSVYGCGQYPNSESATVLKYLRNTPFTKTAGEWPNLSNTWYNKNNPPNDGKMYFDGPHV
jgi:hypothetical protein